MPVIINGTTGVTTPGISVDGTTAGVNGAFFSIFDNDSPVVTSYTPQLTPSNWKYIQNSGAFTFIAPAASGADSAYSMVVYMQNVTGAGAVTMSGFNRVVGDSFTTTVGHVFFIYITVFGAGNKIANVVAAQ